MKKISIIIPCYNVERYIERCLDSLVHQTIGIDNLELILVNDASTDDTLSYLTRYEEKYPESIIVIDCKENGRQGTARNIGLTYATADYIAYVDSDDWCELDMFERLYIKAQEYGCEMVVCESVRDKGDAVCEKKTENNCLMVFDTEEKVSDCIVCRSIGEAAWARLMKKSLLVDNEIYFAEGLYYEDVLWLNLLYPYVKNVYYMDEQMYHYFVNTESTVLTKNTERHLEFYDVVELLWQEYHERGLWDRYKAALELDYIRTLYFQGLKMLSLRFDRPPFAVFQYMVDTINERIPNWKSNPYVMNDLYPFYRRLLSMTERKMSEQEFLMMINVVKSSW